MSQENVEIVRRVFGSINRGDIDGALENADDDFEADWSNSIGPAKGTYSGKEQVRDFWMSFIEAFDEVWWGLDEVIEVDESRVIAAMHTRLRGRGSGVEVGGVGAQLWTIRHGRARRVKLFQSRDDALEAVGLPK